MAICNCFIAYTGLWVFYLLCFLNGLATGAVNSAGNVIVLDIWRGHGGEHWMHLLHFSCAGGNFLGPVIVKPFLTVTEHLTTNATLSHHTLLEEKLHLNESNGIAVFIFEQRNTQLAINVWQP